MPLSPLYWGLVGPTWVAVLTALGVDAETECGPARRGINDFSSRAAMESNGWALDWDDNINHWDFVALPDSTFCNGVASTSYCGFSAPGAGAISLALSGAGSATIDFGNSWVSGLVTLYLNGTQVAVAEGSTPSHAATFEFQSGDELVLVEDPMAVIVINHIDFSCSGVAVRGRVPAARPRRRPPRSSSSACRLPRVPCSALLPVSCQPTFPAEGALAVDVTDLHVKRCFPIASGAIRQRFPGSLK
ncbi:hypothetical protein CYMTET_20687 [Cymbomonas tetramitiformis]|uniref:Uncharacterized protein n=1 Tax=Cymbomonas tetramitiformis TaxID=36881 RepID=A0AAE0L401_9CHLO|nr:hypothetical protein CYMTET_20687 [Cymbomonas tetramitiformis]